MRCWRIDRLGHPVSYLTCNFYLQGFRQVHSCSHCLCGWSSLSHFSESGVVRFTHLAYRHTRPLRKPWMVSLRNKHMIRFTLRAGRPQFSENYSPSVPHSSSHNRFCLVSGQLHLPALRRETHALRFTASSLILPTGTSTPSWWFICGSPPQAVRCGTGFGRIPIASGRRRSAQLLKYSGPKLLILTVNLPFMPTSGSICQRSSRQCRVSPSEVSLDRDVQESVQGKSCRVSQGRLGRLFRPSGQPFQ